MTRLALPKEVTEKGEEAKGYRYAYDASDRILSLTGPDGTLIYKRSYNPYGELEQETDNRGSGIRFVYDHIGRRIQAKTTGNAEERYEYDVLGNLTAATDGENHKVKYGYNCAGKLSSRTDAAGNTEYFTYDVEGRLNRHKDRNGGETTYTYNMYHDLVKREHKASGLQEVYYITRLPRNNGHWSGERDNSLWYSDLEEVRRAKVIKYAL